MKTYAILTALLCLTLANCGPKCCKNTCKNDEVAYYEEGSEEGNVEAPSTKVAKF